MVYDIAIIGGGPGGYVAALYAAAKGLAVALVERDQVGGTCLNRGCIPAKTLVQTAHVWEQFRRAEQFGIRTGPGCIRWEDVIARKDQVVKQLTGGVLGLLKARKVDLFRGEGTVCAPNRVRVTMSDGGSRIIEAGHLILACGSYAARLPVPGAELPDVVTSDGIFSLPGQPRRLTIVGSGVIGLEMAYVYQTLGTEVTIVEALPALLPQWDCSITAELARLVKDLGITLHTSARVTGFVPAEEGVETAVVLEDGREIRLCSDKVLLSVGRRPVRVPCENVTLETTEKGFVKVNDHMEASIKGVYAIGDINGRCMLAHGASHQGITAVNSILNIKPSIGQSWIPSCIYLSPGAASVGLTEQQAREKFGEKIKVAIFPLRASGMAAACNESRGFIKIIADARWGELLGVHIMAADACELIAEAAALLSCEATVEHLIQIVHPHPSLSEALMEGGFMLNGTPIHTL